MQRRTSKKKLRGVVGAQNSSWFAVRTKYAGLGLIELLVTLGIIITLWALMIPMVLNARQRASGVVTMNNQRLIVIAANCFASDHNGRYPPSAATVGTLTGHWNWQQPNMLTSPTSRGGELHRSVSAYLRSYIKDAGIMFCPNAPTKYKYLAQAWPAGDNWDNPQTPCPADPVVGTYCFYWNYKGYIAGAKKPFTGPETAAGGFGQSRLLISDYFGYGHWRNKTTYGTSHAYGSCEKFKGAYVTRGTAVSSDFWSLPGLQDDNELNGLDIKLHAGYTDGHVESYSPSRTVGMSVSITADGCTPYPSEIGPGVFYLPRDPLR